MLNVKALESCKVRPFDLNGREKSVVKEKCLDMCINTLSAKKVKDCSILDTKAEIVTGGCVSNIRVSVYVPGVRIVRLSVGS